MVDIRNYPKLRTNSRDGWTALLTNVISRQSLDRVGRNLHDIPKETTVRKFLANDIPEMGFGFQKSATLFANPIKTNTVLYGFRGIADQNEHFKWQNAFAFISGMQRRIPHESTEYRTVRFYWKQIKKLFRQTLPVSCVELIHNSKNHINHTANQSLKDIT